MGELLTEDNLGSEAVGAPWSVERRFRVTEVFLAVLWVWISLSSWDGRVKPIFGLPLY
jgi:hypothetical protein